MSGGKEDRAESRTTSMTPMSRRRNLVEPRNSREQYRCGFRGHPAVDARRLVAGSDPREPSRYRLFRREAMKVAKLPEKPTPA